MVVWCIYSSYSLRTSSERSFFFLLQEVTRACRQHANQSLGHGIFIPEKIIEVVSLVWHPPQLPSCCRRHKLIDDWFHWRRKKNKVFESSPILPYRSYRSTKSYGSSCWAHSILTIYIWRWTMNTMLRTMTLDVRRYLLRSPYHIWFFAWIHQSQTLDRWKCNDIKHNVECIIMQKVE